MNTNTLTLRLPHEEYVRLKTVAKDRGKSLNRVVREAISADLNSTVPVQRQWRMPVTDTQPPVGTSSSAGTADDWDSRLEGFGQW